MLMVIPVYGTDRQSQRKLSPREGGDCTQTLLPAPSTRTSSAPSCTLSFGGSWGVSDGAPGAGEQSAPQTLGTQRRQPCSSPRGLSLTALILG